mgnify:FL=1
MVDNASIRERQWHNFLAFQGLTREEFEAYVAKAFSRPWGELKASQKRGRLLSEQFLCCYGRHPYRKEERRLVAWRSLFMPTEIIYAMGFVPFTLEMFAAQVSMMGRAVKCLEAAEENGFAPDLCSFVKAAAGAMLLDILPQPDVILTSTHLCDPAAKLGEYASARYRCPEFVLDVPYGAWSWKQEEGGVARLEEAVDYVAGQLVKMAAFMTEVTGAELEMSELRRAVAYANEAAGWLSRGNNLAYYHHKPLLRGSKDMDHAANLVQTWGTPELADIYRTRYEELRSAAESAPEDVARPRIVWAHLRPYYPNVLLDYIEERADIVGSIVNYSYWENLDAGNPFRAMAYKALLNPAFSPLASRVELYARVIRPGDGIVAFYPKSCRHFHCSGRMEAESFRSRGIPMLVIDGDCVDDRGDDFLVVKTRIDRFLKELASGKQERT